MTKEEFRDVVLPFLHFYWKRVHYYTATTRNIPMPIRIGNMALFCDKTHVPDVLLIVDDRDNVVDGYAIGRDHLWNGRSAREQLREIGVCLEDEG